MKIIFTIEQNKWDINHNDFPQDIFCDVENTSEITNENMNITFVHPITNKKIKVKSKLNV